jgi:hypothetical protein
MPEVSLNTRVFSSVKSDHLRRHGVLSELFEISITPYWQMFMCVLAWLRACMATERLMWVNGPRNWRPYKSNNRPAKRVQMEIYFRTFCADPVFCCLHPHTFQGVGWDMEEGCCCCLTYSFLFILSHHRYPSSFLSPFVVIVLVPATSLWNQDYVYFTTYVCVDIMTSYWPPL